MPKRIIPRPLERAPKQEEVIDILEKTEALLKKHDDDFLWGKLSSVGVRNDVDAVRLLEQLLGDELGKVDNSTELAGQCATLITLKSYLKETIFG